MVDYYSILDVSSNASEEEIRRAYRRKAKLHHPDVNKSSDAHQTFVLIQKAYQVLSSPYTKSQYDHQRGKVHDPLQSYQEWVTRQQARREQAARRKHQDFLRKQKAIQESKMYYPYLMALYAITFLVVGTCVLILIGCAIVVLYYHIFIFFVLLPIICVAAYVLKSCYDTFKDTRALFSSVS